MKLQFCVSSCAHATIDESAEFPDDDLDWEEFDPTPLESWILDDFDWEIEVPYPERGDYWDDSLDGEWDVAAAAAMTNTEIRMTKQFRMMNDEGVCWPVLHVAALCRTLNPELSHAFLMPH